jgi:hypothetical protein
VSLTPAKEKFAQAVASAIGLELATVRTWVAAEGGPDDNPLNIMGWTASGQRYIRHFVTPAQAATATVNLLRKPTYVAVTGAARSGNVTTELKAIAHSPWEENQYRGKTAIEGGLLFAAFHGLYGKAPASSAATDTSAVAGTAEPAGWHPTWTDPFGLKPWADRTAGGTTDWLLGLGPELAKALLYVVLTVLALVLGTLGLLRMIGASPTGIVRSLAPAKARTSGAQTDEIPF